MNSECFSHINSYRHATGTSLIPFNSSRRADSNEPSPDPSGRLTGELSPFPSTDSYRPVTALSLIPFDSSQRADSNEGLPDSIRPLVVELTSFLNLAARAPSTWNYSYRELQ